MDDEQCPKCGVVFPPERAWADDSIVMTLLDFLLTPVGFRHVLDNRVKCPSCGTVFHTAHRAEYFGAVGFWVVRVFAVIFGAALLVAGILYLRGGFQ